MWQQNLLNLAAPTPTPPLPPLPLWYNADPLTVLRQQHRGCPVRGAERRKDGGGGGANSDSYSLNVSTSQRGPHDTATKSELMDSFLSPANMTGGVCERVKGCVGEGRGLVRVPVCPIEGAHGPMSLVLYIVITLTREVCFPWALNSSPEGKRRGSFNGHLF